MTLYVSFAWNGITVAVAEVAEGLGTAPSDPALGNRAQINLRGQTLHHHAQDLDPARHP